MPHRPAGPSELERFLDPGQKIQRRERLCEVEVRAGDEADLDVALLCLGCEKDHACFREPGIRLDRAQYVEAVLPRHLHVEQHERWLQLLGQRPGLRPVRGLDDRVVVGLDCGVNEKPDARFVVRDEDCAQAFELGRSLVVAHHPDAVGMTARTPAIKATAACGAPASFGSTAVTPFVSRADISPGTRFFMVRTTVGSALPRAHIRARKSSPCKPGSARSRMIARGLRYASRSSAVSASAARTVLNPSVSSSAFIKRA